MFFFLIFVAISTYYIYHWTFWKRRGVPGPWGIPILGKSGVMLDDRSAPPLLIQEWTKKYGKVYGFTEGMQKVMVISDPDMVQEVFVKQYDNFFGRKVNPIQGDPDKDKDVPLVGAQGFRWKRLRTISAPAFTNSSIKKVMPRIENSVQEFLKHLEQNGENGKPVNMHLYFQEYTMDVIMRIAMGQPESRMFKNPMLYDCKGFFENSRWPVWMFSGAFPFAVKGLRYLFLKLGKFGAGPFIRVQKQVTDAVNDRIAQREADRQQEMEPGEPQDFIDFFLDAQADVDFFGETNDEYQKSTIYNNRKLTMQEIITNCFLFVVAGFDTTAISLSYVAYFLSLNPRVQRKLQEEVDRECRDSEITFEQLSKLKYMENTIKEALRVFPMAAFANSRRCMRTTKIGDTVVEEGVDILVDTWTLHHDKKVWGEDADEFKPERWESPLNPHQSFMAFGAGPRVCLGVRLAYLEQKVLLAHVLRKYSFVANTQTQVPMKLVGRATSRPQSLILSVEPRLPDPRV